MSPTKTQLASNENYSIWLEELMQAQPKLDRELITKACELADAQELGSQQFQRQDPFDAGISIATELAEIQCDSASLAAAIIYPTAYAHKLDEELLSQKISPVVSKLVKGVLLIESLHATQHHKSTGARQAQADKLRKMLLAMVGDLRVVLIKLAERLIALKTLRHADPQEQQLMAEDVMNVYAPLANRLGLGQLKWQLEDWSFRYLKREDYEDIFKVLKMRRNEREAHVSKMIEHLTHLVESTHIKTVDISGRAKHIYSIYRKLANKQITMDKLYDMIAIRVLVPSIQDCYSVLGIVHATWPHIQSEFDDYIAHPKPNGYRSIHTAILDETQYPVEIQIRTLDMHQEAELGVAAHWVYKEGTQQPSYENKINVLRSLLDWQKELSEDSQRAAEALLNDHVYVFTPNGDVIDMENGATPLDFAYHVHTELGHSCRGAKINGVLVPLTYTLKTGDQVSILSTKNGEPSRDWMRSAHGYLKTARARQKVAAWFKKQSIDEHSQLGYIAWEKACRQLIIHKNDLARAVKHFNFKSTEGLMAAIGSGDLKISTVLNYLEIEHPESEHSKQTISEEIKTSAPKKPSRSSIIIEGVGDLFTQIARCCKPIPGDTILGYITRDRGVTIHQKNCRNIAQAVRERPERVLEVSFGQHLATRYAIDLVLETTNRHGISRDISNLIANEKITLTNFNARNNENQNQNFINLSIEVENLDVFEHLLNQLQQLPGVLGVRRK